MYSDTLCFLHTLYICVNKYFIYLRKYDKVERVYSLVNLYYKLTAASLLTNFSGIINRLHLTNYNHTKPDIDPLLSCVIEGQINTTLFNLL